MLLKGESNDHVSLNGNKSKNIVLPVKQMTIHHLELMTATIGARLTNSVLESIELKDV